MKNQITSSICCDIILPVTNCKNAIRLLEKAAETPQWLRHTFIVLLDGVSHDDEKDLQEWYYEIRVRQAMPSVIISRVRSDLVGNLTAIYNSGVLMGDSPFVYFQNEKDPLPVNIDKVINFLYKNEDVSMCVGRCETYLNNQTLLESFPMVSINGKFLYDNREAIKLFPSYLHPLSAVIRKTTFKKVPYWDMTKSFGKFAYYYFILRCLYNSSINVSFMPVTIKISIRKPENAVAMGPKTRQMLLHDLKLALQEMPDNEYKDFQLEIIALIEKGEITTFKEIDARVEEYIDRK